MRMRRKHNLTSRLEKCAHLLIDEPDKLSGNWLSTFKFNKLSLELGCGKGQFIVQNAFNNPDILFVALEKVDNVIVAAMELADSKAIKNIRFICKPAENLAEYFAPCEISRIYINFCDPWPSQRHIKRRLVASTFLCVYNNLLSFGGDVEFKTDNLQLFEFALGEIGRNNFSVVEQSRNLHNTGNDIIMTEYESKFVAQGLPIYYCRAVKD